MTFRLPCFYVGALILLWASLPGFGCREPSLSVASGNQYAIATDHPLASKIGLEVLRKGGNVADALVASSFAVSVLRPQSTGIGGGGFAMIRVFQEGSSPRTFAYDFRERAPALAHPRMYLDSKGELIPNLSLFGYSSVAVPGVVKGLWEIHRAHGVLSWSELLAPSIDLAENGFPVYKNLEEAINTSVKNMNPAMQSVFTREGIPLKEGDILVQKDLAYTLRKIANQGYREFYEGETAISIHENSLRGNGALRIDDLKNYQVRSVLPIKTSYRGYTIESFPLPSSAAFMFQILGILEKYDIERLYTENASLYSQILIEAMAEGFRDRGIYGGDMQFALDTQKFYSKETILKKKRKIEDKIAKMNAALGNGKTRIPRQNTELSPFMESYNTTHISIMDSMGNVATSTQSINYIFGSRIIVPGTGIILNDTMDDFSTKSGAGNVYGLVGGSANSIQPGKTPLSSMSPTIVYRNEKPWFTLGAPGGAFIFTAILQVILQKIDFKQESGEAVRAPRIHYQWKPDIVFLEEGWQKEAVQHLSQLYNLKISKSKAKVFLVEHNPAEKLLIGVSDPRGEGQALAR